MQPFDLRAVGNVNLLRTLIKGLICFTGFSKVAGLLDECASYHLTDET